MSLALKVEEAVQRQGVWVGSRSWKKQKEDSLLGPPEWKAALPTA